MLKIEHNLGSLQKRLSVLERQIPFAAARALTIIGQDVSNSLSVEINDVFDRPTKYISGSPFRTVATKANLETTVGIRDQSARGAAPSKYVKEFFGSGGQRNQKPFEVALSKLGILPDGWKAAPAAGMKLDANGNPNRSQIKEIFGVLRTGFGVAQGRGKSSNLKSYFVVRPDAKDARSARLGPGIYRRIKRGVSSAIIPMFAFIPTASYRKKFNLRDAAQKVIDRKFDAVFSRELANAVRTARG